MIDKILVIKANLDKLFLAPSAEPEKELLSEGSDEEVE